MTDIGGLDDRSFNFLANKGLAQAKKELKIQGRVFISKSNADYVPNLTTAARGGYNLVISVGFLMGDATAQVAKRFPKTKFAIIDFSGVKMKGNPTNVRGLLFKEQEAGYLVGYLAAKQVTAKTARRHRRDRGRRRSQDPAGRPVHRRLLPGREEGLPGREGRAQLLPGLRRPGEVQGAGAQPHRQRRRRRLPGRGPVRPRRPVSAAKEKGVFGIGVDADQGYLGHARPDERHEEGRRRRVTRRSRPRRRRRAKFRTNFNADLHREERRRRLRQDLADGRSPRGRRRSRTSGCRSPPARSRSPRQSPPALGLGRCVHRKGRGFESRPFRYDSVVMRRPALALLVLLAAAPLAGCGGDDDDAATHDRGATPATTTAEAG